MLNQELHLRSLIFSARDYNNLHVRLLGFSQPKFITSFGLSPWTKYDLWIIAICNNYTTGLITCSNGNPYLAKTSALWFSNVEVKAGMTISNQFFLNVNDLFFRRTTLELYESFCAKAKQLNTSISLRRLWTTSSDRASAFLASSCLVSSPS